MMRKRYKSLSLLLVFSMVVSMVYGLPVNAFMVDDLVSVKTVNTDVCVSTTVNSLYDVDDVRNELNMYSTTDGSSARVNTARIDTTDLSNWYVYDHYDKEAFEGETTTDRKRNWLAENGYKENLRPYYENKNTVYSENNYYGNITGYTAPLRIPELIEKTKPSATPKLTWGYVYYLKEHIAATSEGGKAAMNFYGYPEHPYTDFLFYPAASEGMKKVHYTVDARDVRTHSLNSAGFLFNTGVSKVNGTDVLNGYLLLFDYQAPSGGGVSANAVGFNKAYIYKLFNTEVEKMHEGRYLPTGLQDFSPTSQLIKTIDLYDTSKFPFEGHFDVSNISMEITSNSVNVTMEEAGANVSANPKKVTLFSINSLVDTNFGGFGPLVSYNSHSCWYTSSYKYSNLQMSIATTDSVLDGLSRTDFINQGVSADGQTLEDTTKFYVLIGDNEKKDDGYKDFFHLQSDAAFLERLKKENIILITNLNIEPDPNDINGVDYKLSDYLGEGNVFQVHDDTIENMAQEIKDIINATKYNKQNADDSDDALGNVIDPEDQVAAGCQVTYKGYQVDSIDGNQIPSAGVQFDIEDPVAINVSEPKYSVAKPNGDVLDLGSQSYFKIYPNVAWPTGDYVVTITYKEGVSAYATFSMVAIYDSYLNGEASSKGKEDDGVQARMGDIGPKTVKRGEDFIAVFPKTAFYDIPNLTYVGIDDNRNGTIEESEKLDSDKYTFEKNATEAVLKVSKDVVTSDVYIEAKQPYKVYKVNWHMGDLLAWNPLDLTYHQQMVRSTDPYLGGKIFWDDCRDYYGDPDITVEVNGVPVNSSLYTYNPNNGEFKLQNSALTGNIDVYAERPFLEADVIVEKTNLEYEGPNRIQGTNNYSAKLVPELGYQLPQSIKVQHKPGNVVLPAGQEREFKDYPLGTFSYSMDTGKIELPAQYFDGEIKVIAEAEVVDYSITAETENVSFQGLAKGNIENKYTAKLIPSQHYDLPESIVVKRGDQEIMEQGYTYDNTTGDITIDKGEIYDNIVIQASSSITSYPVTCDATNVEFSGAASGNAFTVYEAELTVKPYHHYTSPVEVKRDGEEMTSGFSFNEGTGKLVIDKGEITGPIEIIAKAELNQYNVTTSLKNLSYQGPNKGDYDHAYEGKIVSGEAYSLPESITVKVGGQAIKNGYTYNEETGEVKIDKNVITANVVIEAKGDEKNFKVEGDVKHGTFEGEDKAYAAANYRATIKADSAYVLPQTISVTVGNEPLNEGVQYIPDTGDIVIQASKIRGNIKISAVCDPRLNPVIFNVKNIVPAGNSTVASYDEYTAVLKPSQINYVLPKTISVRVADKVLESGKDFVYDENTGALAILKDIIDGDVFIEAEATKIVLKEEEKIPQPTPNKEDLTIIPPTYENTKDGKIIGVSSDMEYSLDGGKTWIQCKESTIKGLGVGTVHLRLIGDETKQYGAIVGIEIESETSEYYIPTISMSKKMGRNQKFQIKLKNTADAVLKVVSTNPKVATVNQKGVIKTKKKLGTTKIVITALKGKHIVQYVADITVSKNVKKNYSLSKFSTKYTGPTLALYKLIYRGKTWKINMTHTKGSKITYKSSNSRVASVSKAGKVKAKRDGTATITINVVNKKVADQYSVVVRVKKKGSKDVKPSYLKVLK